MKCPQCNADLFSPESCVNCHYNKADYDREILSNEFDMIEKDIMDTTSVDELRGHVITLLGILRKELLK